MFSVGASFNVNSHSHRRMSLSSAAWASSSSAIRKIHFTDALLSGRGTIRKNYLWKEKAEYFGVDFKTDLIVENETVEPYSIIKGHLVIDTKFPIEHDGIFVQLEAICNLTYSTKHKEHTTMHTGKACILENAFVNPFGHLESPTWAKCEIVPITPPEFGGHSLNSGVWNYPFQLHIPCDPCLPAPFQNTHGNLEYRLVVYMISHSSASYVKLTEKSMKCEGHYNLYDVIEEATKPIVIEQYYRKSYFSNKKLVKATLSIQSSGFLHKEEIPFTLCIKNPKCLPLHMSVNLQQHIKYQASTDLASVVKIVTCMESQEKDECDDPKSKIRWDGRLRVPENEAPPTYACNSMYSVNYMFEFQVKSLDEVIISGAERILLGTAREPIKQPNDSAGGTGSSSGDLYRSGSETSLRSESQRSIYSIQAYSVPANLNLSIDDSDEDENGGEDGTETTEEHIQGSSSEHVPSQDHPVEHEDHLNTNESGEMTEAAVGEPIAFPSPSHESDGAGSRRGSEKSTLTLPPSYSQLSSRIPSTETLPPTYADLDFSVTDSPDDSSLGIGNSVVDLDKRYAINLHSLNLDDKYQVTFYSV